MNALSRVFASAFPSWAKRRALSRLQFEVARQRLDALREFRERERVLLSTYSAAEKTRNTGDWPAKNLSADAPIVADSQTMRARARAAVRDDWAGRSLRDAHIRHVVGTGIWPKADARDPVTDLPFTEFNAWTDWWFERWARTAAWVDIERRKTLLGVQSLAIGEAMTAGESFCLVAYEQRRDMVGLVLQMFEPEQLDVSLTEAENGNEVRNGIEIDDYSAPVAYWVYRKQHPLDSYRAGKSERIPAERVIHLMRQDRPRQTHGVTRMASVLKKLFHLGMYDEYTLLRARFEACGGATIESDLDAVNQDIAGAYSADETSTGTDSRGTSELIFEPNMLWPLPPGKHAVFHDPKVPGGNYEPFTKQQTIEIAAGGGVDYPTLTRDFSGNTFSGQRQGMLELELETDPEQTHLIDQFLRVIWEAFVTYGVLEGRRGMDAPGFNSDPELKAAYLEALFQVPPKPWIDPANQAAALKVQLETRMTSRTREIRRGLGATRDQIFQEIADDQEAAADKDIFLPETESQAATPHESVPKPVQRAPAGMEV